MVVWMHRQAINNSTFLKEQDIGKAVSDWTFDYNKKRVQNKQYQFTEEGIQHSLYNC